MQSECDLYTNQIAFLIVLYLVFYENMFIVHVFNKNIFCKLCCFGFLLILPALLLPGL